MVHRQEDETELRWSELGWWWFFWLISSFAGNASFRTSLEAETAAELQVSRARRQEAQ